MGPILPVSRDNDGSSHFDFYRTQAAARRCQAMRDSATLRRACVGLPLILLVFPLVVAVMVASIRAPHSHVVAAQSSASTHITTEQVQ